MGATTRTKPKGWAKVTKREWTGIIIHMVDVVSDAAADVGFLADEDGNVEAPADVVAILEKAAKAEREKLIYLLREYGREYCDDQGDGYKGSSKAQIAFVGGTKNPYHNVETIIEVVGESEKRKPVTTWLVAFAAAFAAKFAK